MHRKLRRVFRISVQGCPHNTSTKVPEGSRAYAGIGCHYMVQWMDRATIGSTQMGGEGANWIGEAPFSTTQHVFQNIGDGTYNHSGLLAIRAALAAGTTMTYKILFNDAVAMTGGQEHEGALSAARIADEVRAMGVKNLALVYDDQEDINLAEFPKDMTKHHRDELLSVEEKLRDTKGVSVLLYVQTCAAEKRRRRKRGTFPNPDKRVFINTDICEGCGDCGVQSNCVSIVPVETEMGRKRAIDQSSCNKDFSCVNGFCPSFVTVSGAKIRKSATASVDIGDLPEPVIPKIDGTHNIVITGVGGTGVVTIGAILAMAAHVDGKGAGMMEMAGLAQKGGAVHIHCRLANKPGDISAIRVATGECDTLIGGDLVTSAGSKTLGLMKTGRTGAVVNSHEIITGDFTRDTEFQLPTERLGLALQARLQERLSMFDASGLAKTLLGDSIFSNMMMLGAAWQQGFVPLSFAAIEKAVTLNGTAVENNLRAFEYGRWAMVNPAAAEKLLVGEVVDKPKNPEQLVDFFAEKLTLYQSRRLAKRYRKLLARAENPVLMEAMARGYYKVLAYKDEYEVARLHLATGEKLRAEFDGDLKVTYHLSPPLISKAGPNGRPLKKEYGAMMGRMFPVLARFKRLRGTPFDPFGYGAERRAERAAIKTYEGDMKEVLAALDGNNSDAAVALAGWPMLVRGYGPVQVAARKLAMARRGEMLTALRGDGQLRAQAAE